MTRHQAAAVQFRGETFTGATHDDATARLARRFPRYRETSRKAEPIAHGRRSPEGQFVERGNKMKKLLLIIGLGIAFAMTPPAKAQAPVLTGNVDTGKSGETMEEVIGKIVQAKEHGRDIAKADEGEALEAKAQGIADLRSIRQIRAQAIEAARAAEKEAQDAAAGAKEAEQKARNARNWVTGAVGNDGINSMVFSQALAGREKFEQEADAAREEAAAKAREAADIAEQSQRIIAKANAQEAIIKSQGIDD